MSWKITKKLKETHLAPLGNPFSRSSSTSTITPSDPSISQVADDSSSTKVSATVATANAAAPSPSNSSSDPAGILASEAQITQPPPPVKPGVLVFSLHEGKGFSLSEEAERVFSAGSQNSTGPYSNSARPNSAAFAQNGGSISSSVSGWRRPKTAGPGINAAPSIHGRYNTMYLPYALVEFDKQEIVIPATAGTPENPQFTGENSQFKFDVLRTTDLTITLFIRNPSAPAGSGRSTDLFIGTRKIQPKFEEGRSETTMTSLAGPEWYEVQYGTGSVKVGLNFIENKKQSLTTDDFELIAVVGRGSFGKVMQVKKKDTENIYAMKTIRKDHIISRSEVSHTLAERSVLAQINNPFIVPLKFSFQSPQKLYLVLAFVNGGELFFHLQKEQRFELNRARFYTAELLCALECLHGFNVIYRDLKPENILLDYSGHIALCDFGLCKRDMKDQDTTNTFCGTPEYLAPELLHGTGYTKTVDWWTLGVLLYEMLTGLPPFYDENTNEMYRKILTEPLHFPSDQRIMPPAARDLLTKLLDRRPDHRLGVNGASEIKAHPFFQGIDWRKLLQRKYEPAFKPRVRNQRDTTNFDTEFTNEQPSDSFVEGPALSQTAQAQFAGWSYNRPVAGLMDAGGSVKDPGFESAK